MHKRDFIKLIGGLSLLNPFYLEIEALLKSRPSIGVKPEEDEYFWSKIRAGYRLKPDYINLENGYYCIQPQQTLEAFIEHAREVNLQGSYYMRTVQQSNKDAVAAAVADMVGAQHDELIITRNTTEALDTVICGIPWKAGDEAVWAIHDYSAMQNQFKLMEKRYGIVNKVVELPVHPTSDEEIVKVYKSAITERTKLLMVCHIINITGQILPVRKICDMAHEQGVEVMVDGAHAVGHFEFNIKDLHCDYYGCSLHKWLSVPIGAGFLYVQKDKIQKLWPMFAQWGGSDDDIYKLNHTGTHPPHTDLTILDAIYYHELLGGKRKEDRLRFLQRYWSDQLRDHENIMVNTPVASHRSCAIANVGIKHIEPKDLAKRLLDEYGIWTVAIDQKNVQGCRITPNIFTSIEELDQFVAAMLELADA